MLKQSLDGVEALLLVGGPAGCGKTTIADNIVEAPGQFELPASCPQPFHRTDWKSLEAKRFGSGTVIVEFATNRLNDPVQLQTVSYFIDALQRAAPIRGAYTSIIVRSPGLACNPAPRPRPRPIGRLLQEAARTALIS